MATGRKVNTGCVGLSLDRRKCLLALCGASCCVASAPLSLLGVVYSVSKNEKGSGGRLVGGPGRSQVQVYFSDAGQASLENRCVSTSIRIWQANDESSC